MTSKPCAKKWCAALATRGEYCQVHSLLPYYDPRSYDEIMASHDPLPPPQPQPRGAPKVKPVPVDERPLIVESEK